MIDQSTQLIQRSAAKQPIVTSQAGSPDKKIREREAEIEQLKHMLSKSQAKERKLTQEIQTKDRKIRELEALNKSTHRD